MTRPLICSSYTISGVMPGGPAAGRHSFRKRAEAASAAGYQGLCLHLRDYAEQRARGINDAEMRAILDGEGLVEVGLEFLTGWDDEDGRPAPLEDAAWQAAQGLGARILNVGCGMGSALPAPEAARLRFEALAGRAAREGVAVALEIVPWSAVPDLASARLLTRGIPNAGLVIDSWHVFRGGIPLSDLAQVPGDEILGIQINDAKAEPDADLCAETCRRLCCGEGSFDLPGFIDALRRTGTRAPLSVEIISPELDALGAHAAARRSVSGVAPLLRALGPAD